ncbi:MAG: aminomethyl-transferring glycine dehydrogenase subunit GcvPB, partial [Pseudomonadota bacterium]
MTMNTQGRPTTPSIVANGNGSDSVSGSKGLSQREDLIFEIGTPDTTGVDLPAPKGRKDRLGGVARKDATGLPGLSEPETVRHY